MQLTRENYYTRDADIEYMSCSQYQGFLRCEAAEMAKLRGTFIPSPSEALTVGQCFHSALESPEAFDEFCAEHFNEIFKTNKKTGEITGKYAPYEMADKMLESFHRDPTIEHLIKMDGENEVIMTGTLFGMPWKIRLDKYVENSRLIIDWKTCADINKTEYNPVIGERESFVEALGYLMRAAVYSEIEKQNRGVTEDPPFVIAAVSKQDPPDKIALSLNHRQRYDFELEQIEKHIGRIAMVKRGQVKPRRCGKCEYCRSTKIIKKIVPYYTLNPKFLEDKEEEYDEAFNLEIPSEP